MGKDPALMLYTSDFLTNNADLDMEERGQFITLLCLHHQNGRLSKKLIALNVPNVSKDVMVKFKKDKNGLYYNDRLEEEAQKRRKHSQKQSDNANKRWDKERAKKNAKVDAMEDAMALPLENENENENENGLLSEEIIKSNNEVKVEENIKDRIKGVDRNELLNKIKRERKFVKCSDELDSNNMKLSS